MKYLFLSLLLLVAFFSNFALAQALLIPIKMDGIVIFIPYKSDVHVKQKTLYYYDARGRLIKVDNKKSVVNYKYDDAGNRTKVHND